MSGEFPDIVMRFLIGVPIILIILSILIAIDGEKEWKRIFILMKGERMKERMNDLISRQAAINEIQKDRIAAWKELIDENAEYQKGCDDGYAYSLKIISEELPTIDAVPVARCKDCKYHEADYCHRGGIYGNALFVKDDDFCSYWERRTNGRKERTENDEINRC